MKYDYRKEITKDIFDYVEENYTAEEIAEKLADRDEFESTLNDDLWIEDSVTGNASGSYTFSRATAREYVVENMEDCIEALKCFCCEAETIAEKFLSEDWEFFDVTIRCYLLGECLGEAIDKLWNKYAQINPKP